MSLKEGSMGGYCTVDRLVLDTGVLVEYIVLRSKFRFKVSKLFNMASMNKIKLYISPITLSEILYVVSKIYEAAGVPSPNIEALDYVEWIRRKTEIVKLSDDIIFRTGELKKTLRIALSDCYVIASAEAVNAVPLFKAVEKEMMPVIDELRRLGVKFLEEIEV